MGSVETLVVYSAVCIVWVMTGPYVCTLVASTGSRRVDQISIKTRSGRTPSGSTFRTESSVSSRLTIHPINRSVAACATLQVWPSRARNPSRIGDSDSGRGPGAPRPTRKSACLSPPSHRAIRTGGTSSCRLGNQRVARRSLCLAPTPSHAPRPSESRAAAASAPSESSAYPGSAPCTAGIRRTPEFTAHA